MAPIGQVVYNLEDFHGSGGLISTSKTNMNDKPVSWDGDSKTKGAYQASQFDIFSDIVGKFTNGGEFLKLGIQAPPGTKVKLNSNKIIMIGRTGTYELD